MRSIIPAAIMLFTPVIAAAQEATTEDRTAIEAVRTEFARAIEAKDLPAMQALFYDGQIEWRGALHPPTREAVGKMTGAPQPVVDKTGAHLFLNDPQFANIHLREGFGPMNIDTDGQLASATFNYAFYANDKLLNWGRENWQMVKTPEGWRILNLLFTATLTQVAPMPIEHLAGGETTP